MSDSGKLARATIFVAVLSPRDEEDYDWVQEWFVRWGEHVRVERDLSSAPDYLCEVEGAAEAIAEIPERMLCNNEWSQKPYPPARDRKDRRHDPP